MGPHVGGVNLLGLAYLILVLAVIFVPLLVRRGSPPNDDEDGRDDGRGGGPADPPPLPRGPSDGLPLSDAEPPRVRLRSHGRLGDHRPRPARRSKPHPPSKPRPRV